jgi:citrate lyase subunit beta/citryl-CoA lyase
VTSNSTERRRPSWPTPSRTWLFVPGDRPDRFDKAAASAAHEIICDLEDAVADGQKISARDAVVEWLSAGASAWVRVNGLDTEWHQSDVSALSDAPGLRGLIVPKAEDPAALEDLAGRLRQQDRRRRLIALVESARGIMQANELASSNAVDQLAFGSIDYAADVDADHSPDALLLARTTLVQASRAARKPAPIDGVTTAYRDIEAVAAAARYARGLGFGAKLCIHPAQLGPVEGAFRPSGEQLAWARQVVNAAATADGAVTGLSGHMVDTPVLGRARRILESADEVRALPPTS